MDVRTDITIAETIKTLRDTVRFCFLMVLSLKCNLKFKNHG